MIYWDTSCVLKLYTPEPDSPAYLELVRESTEPLLSSEILSAELYCALCQKELRGDIKPGATERVYKKFLSDCEAGRWVLIPVGTDVINQATQAARACYQHRPPVPLRTVDGLHLGTALLADVTQLVTADRRMRAAAGVLGLELIDV